MVRSQSHFETHADMALCDVRVPRPLASSFTYRHRAPRRPVSAKRVETRKVQCNWYPVLAFQSRWLALTVGWMLPVGKGGARLRAGDTDGSIYPAGSGVKKPEHVNP